MQKKQPYGAGLPPYSFALAYIPITLCVYTHQAMRIYLLSLGSLFFFFLLKNGVVGMVYHAVIRVKTSGLLMSIVFLKKKPVGYVAKIELNIMIFIYKSNDGW